MIELRAINRGKRLEGNLALANYHQPTLNSLGEHKCALSRTSPHNEDPMLKVKRSA